MSTSNKNSHPTFEANKSGKGILLDVGTNEVEFLEFEVGGQNYAVNVAKVFQVLLMANLPLKAIPDQLGGALGCVLYREELIAAFDLSVLLGGEPVDTSDPRRLIIVTHFNRHSYGFVVTKVLGIERISWKDFSPMKHQEMSNGEPSIVGTILLNGRMIHCVDLEALMSKFDPSQTVEEFGRRVAKETKVDRGSIHLLYCEDSPTVTRMAMRVLATAGFAKLHVETTGAAGLEYLKSPEGRSVNVVLTDIEMPEMDGLTLCKIIKSEPSMKHIPVVFFSSLISEQMAEKCESVHGDAYFSKPEINEVVPAIEQLFVESNHTPSQ